MAEQYSNVELTEMVRIYAVCNNSLPRAVQMFGEMFPNRPRPSRGTVLAATQRLRDYGQFTVPTHAQGRGSAGLSVELQEAIISYFEREPRASTREAGRHFNVDHTSVWRLLRDEHLHPFHYRRVQDLHPQDDVGRVRFCEWLLQNYDKNILWTDECLFTRVGVFNIHNEHWWSYRNPHAIKRDSFQTRFGVNVWAGIIGDRILGPYFIQGRLTSATYLDLLQHIVVEMLEDVPLAYLSDMYYQQDGAPPHYGVQVREYLNRVFEGRWIGRGGPVPWPPRSPDLTPCDFFLWGEIKRLVYKETDEIQTVEILKLKITNAFESVKLKVNILNKLKRNLRRRAQLCIENSGGHFEQYLQYT